MGRTLSQEQRKFDALLRSVLAPVAYSGNLVRDTKQLETANYPVPEGMTEAQAMAVVLGAMFDDEILMDIGNSSSSNGYPEMDWRRIYLFRDLIAGGDNRGALYGDAMLRAREKAKAAFEAFGKGDKTAVKEMIGRAAKAVNKVYNVHEISDKNLWYGISAAHRLIEDAKGNPDLDPVIEEYMPVDPMRAIIDAEADRLRAIDKKLDDKSLPEAERSKLVLEGLVRHNIIEQFNEYDHGNGDIDMILFDEGVDINDGFNTKALPDVNVALKQANEKFRKTHPSTLVYKMRTPEGRKEVYRKFAEQIRTNPQFPELLQNGTINKSLTTVLDDHLSADRRKVLEKEWDNSLPELKNGIKTAMQKDKNFTETLNTKLEGFAKENGFGKHTVLMENLIKSREESIGRRALLQKRIFIVNEQYDKVLSVFSPDGKNFTAKAVDEVPIEIASGTMSRAACIINEALPLMKASKAVESEIANGSKEGLDEVIAGFNELQKLIKRSLSDSTESVKKQLAEKAEALSNINAEVGEEQKKILDTVKEFGKTVADGVKKMDRKIEDFLAVQDKAGSVEKIDLQVRDAELGKIAEKNAKREERLKLQNPVSPGDRSTEASRTLKLYIEQMNEILAENPGIVEIGSKLTASLNKLKENTEKMFTRDSLGNYPAFTQQVRNELISNCLDAMNKSNELLGKLDNNVSNIEIVQITGDIGKMLGRELDTMVSLSPDGKSSLAETIEKSTVVKVDSSGKEFSTVGGMGNTREAMTVVRNGQQIKGFFTKEKKAGISQEDVELIKSFRSDIDAIIPGAGNLLDPAIDMMFANKNFSGRDTLLLNMITVFEENPDLVKTDNPEDFKNDLDFFREGLSDDKPKMDRLLELNSVLDSLHNRLIQFELGIHAEKESSITGRNVAMSKMATLLGRPDLLAKSEFMEKVGDDGKTVNGIFMENARGRSIDTLTQQDIDGFDEHTFDTPSLLNDLADMTIVDYICGNVDRHQHNIFLIFDETNTKVTGVQGIDNDFAFGTDESGADFQAGIDRNKIKVVSTEMADRILSMDKSSIKEMLRSTGITETEIETAGKRLENIKADIKDGRITKVSKEEWANHTIDELAEGAGKHNTFGMMKICIKGNLQITVDKNIEREKEAQKTEKKPFKFEDVKNIDGINAASFEKDGENVDKFTASIDASQKKIWGSGSQQFRDIGDALKAYKEQIGKLGDNPSSMDYLKVQAKLEAIVDTVNRYLENKAGQKLNKNGKERFELAQQMKEHFTKRLDNFKDALHRKDEIEVEEMNAHMKAAAVRTYDISKSVPKDNTKLAEFGSKVVCANYTELGILSSRKTLSKDDIEMAKEGIANIVAFDLMMSERAACQSKGLDVPGPIESKFNESFNNGAEFNKKIQRGIMSNEAFKKFSDSITPEYIGKFLTESPHKLTRFLGEIQKQMSENQVQTGIEPVIEDKAPQMGVHQ